MKCPYCNAWSEVQATRGAIRYRRCANDHRFKTIESVVKRQPSARGSQPLFYRDQQILDAVRSGKTMTETAKSFGLQSHSQVSRIVKRADPNFNARSAGQLARRARKEDER